MLLKSATMTKLLPQLRNRQLYVNLRPNLKQASQDFVSAVWQSPNMFNVFINELLKCLLAVWAWRLIKYR